MSIQLDVDGIGITDDYTSFGGRIEFDIRFQDEDTHKLPAFLWVS